MTKFVTIKPARGADGKPLRIPMPAGLGLPGNGAILPEVGASVPEGDHFVQRLLRDGDAVQVKAEVPKPDAPAPDAPTPDAPNGEHS